MSHYHVLKSGNLTSLQSHFAALPTLRENEVTLSIESIERLNAIVANGIFLISDNSSCNILLALHRSTCQGELSERQDTEFDGVAAAEPGPDFGGALAQEGTGIELDPEVLEVSAMGLE